MSDEPKAPGLPGEAIGTQTNRELWPTFRPVWLWQARWVCTGMMPDRRPCRHTSETMLTEGGNNIADHVRRGAVLENWKCPRCGTVFNVRRRTVELPGDQPLDGA